jgi:hypothetical protein
MLHTEYTSQVDNLDGPANMTYGRILVLSESEQSGLSTPGEILCIFFDIHWLLTMLRDWSVQVNKVSNLGSLNKSYDKRE